MMTEPKTGPLTPAERIKTILIHLSSMKDHFEETDLLDKGTIHFVITRILEQVLALEKDAENLLDELPDSINQSLEEYRNTTNEKVTFSKSGKSFLGFEESVNAFKQYSQDLRETTCSRFSCSC